MSVAITMKDRPDGFDINEWRVMTRLQKLRVLVFQRDGYTCRHCDRYLPTPPLDADGYRRGESLQLDHIIPSSKGGPTSMENLQALCGPCNGRKGDRVRPNGPVGWDAHLGPMRWVCA